MPYYNENTVYYRRLTASYGDVQLPPLGTTPDVVSATPCQNHSRKTEVVAVGRVLFLAPPHLTDHENFLYGRKFTEAARTARYFHGGTKLASGRTNIIRKLSKLTFVLLERLCQSLLRRNYRIKTIPSPSRWITYNLNLNVLI